MFGQRALGAITATAVSRYLEGMDADPADRSADGQQAPPGALLRDRALRWRNVDFPAAGVVVDASWSAGALSSPKSRKGRTVPLADQPAAALARLAQRERFAARDDFVFCNALGTYLDPSALRRRYRRAQQAAGLRELRFHDLRHSFGSLVIREFDVASVKAFMGHAKITTTERYLHSRPRHDDAARMTRVFAGPDLDAAAADVGP